MTEEITDKDLAFLRQAIELARSARADGRHPFGALIVNLLGEIVVTARNNAVRPAGDPTQHAEMLACAEAGKRMTKDVLAHCTLYTSTEPCAMCAGAIYFTGIGRVVFGLAESGLLRYTGQPHREPYPDPALPRSVCMRTNGNRRRRSVARRRSRQGSRGFLGSLTQPCIYTGGMTMLSQVDLVGVGLNATDTLIALEHFPERGSKVEYASANVLPGGQVATAVVACRSWGLSSRYVGIVGDDAAAGLHRQAFTAAGVDTQLITVPGGTSPQSLILVDSGGERTVLCRRDPRVVLQPAHLERAWIETARALHVDGYDTQAAAEAAGWARAAGIPVIADLDELYPGLDSLLVHVDYLIVSRDIPCRLTKEPDLEMALRLMQYQYGCRLAAATLGDDGVLAWDGKQMHHAPAFHVPVVDTTGAETSFMRGLSTGCCRVGRWCSNLILAVLPPR